MPVTKGDNMRGLGVFISDIRNCKSKEAEIKRINKELANIRSKFRGDKTLDGYQKKKYVCKLLFIFLLGHDIDFGHTEAVNLLCSNKFSEKHIGYLFISIQINELHPLMNLIITRLKEDLASNNPVAVNMALQCIANIGGREMAENFAKDIPKLLVSGDIVDSVRQSAALCMLRMARSAPDLIQFGDWTMRVIHLLNDNHLGVVTSAASLIDELVKKKPEEYKGCITLAVSRLSRLVDSSYTDLQDYTYYFVPAPWLSVKLLRLIQNYPPPEDQTVLARLTGCLDNILLRAQDPPKSKKAQHPNAKYAVLFEAINLIIHMDCDPSLIIRACNLLGQFLHNKESNLRYLALESLCLLATSEVSHEAVRKHQETVVNALKTERDVSVRQRAVDLLYAMCDRDNVQDIVREMLVYLEVADYAIREEMVLKVAILAEKYATDYTWYVDTILNLIRVAGDYVSDEVWHRVIQIVVNQEDVQSYAAKMVFQALQAFACHENMVKVAAYILGEFGNLIAGDARSAPKVQFQLLHSKYPLCTPGTRQLILSSYIKFVNLFPEIKPMIQEVLASDSNIRSSDVETQQRAVEYLSLSRMASSDVLATVLEEMPPFPERDSSILAKLKAKTPVKKIPSQHNSLAGDTHSSEQTNHTEPQSEQPNVEAIDLLGLGAPPPSNVAEVGQKTENTGDDFLADILGTPKQETAAATTSTYCNKNEFINLLCQPSGYLFQDQLINVGLRVQAEHHLSRFVLYFRNAAPQPLLNFNTQVVCADTADMDGLGKALITELQAAPDTLEVGGQVQQVVNIECLRPFQEPGILLLSFICDAKKCQYSLLLPITLGTFIYPTVMDQTLYFTCWKQLSQPSQEFQLVCNARLHMEPITLKAKLTGFGVGILENIDSNSNNLVGACILKVKGQEIGILCRLEPNYSTQRYRLTVRSTQPAVAMRTSQLIEQML